MSKFKLPSGAASVDAVVGFNTEKDYTIPLSKKNISKALMESLYINLEQQQEIASLKAELEQHDDQITNIEIVNQEMLSVADEGINKQVDENNELKAQFAAVKYLIDGAYCENYENNTGLEREWLNKLYRMIDTDNDEQCLSGLKIDFIKSTISDIEIGMANAHLDGDDILEYLNLELNKLKEQDNV